MAEEPIYRLRVQYVKEGRLAYLGHLEVLHTIDRSIRRSGVPFAVGQGFARRMKVQFSQALPVGSSSGAEYYDLRLARALPAEEALQMLAQATPASLAPVRAAYVQPRLTALEAWLNVQWWEACVERPPSIDDLVRVIGELRDEVELHFMRGPKPRVVNLADTLDFCEVQQRDEEAFVSLRTVSSPRGALRPQILLEAALARLGCDDSYIRVRRTKQAHRGGAGLVEPFDASIQSSLT